MPDTLATTRSIATSRIQGLVSAGGGALASGGFFLPYLVEPAARMPVTGWELPAARIPQLGVAVGRFTPAEWILAYAVAAFAVTVLMFATHHLLTPRHGIALIVRRAARLGIAAALVLAASIAVRTAFSGPMVAALPGDYVFVALYGFRHVGVGVYLALAGFLLVRLDPTLR